MKMNKTGNSLCLLLTLAVSLMAVATDQSWKQHVSKSDRERTNPYSGQANAVAAGARLFADHCAKCHGEDALGRGKRPSLRTTEVQNASDGELFWILKNGFVRKGMPSWSSLPDPSRWQVVSYVKSLGVSSENHSDEAKSGGQQ
jgi:mono/diheme cytochrome c family protein